ncbi:histidine phosphotransferase ChpT [Faunimonas pinastri]|uniref:Histidine phosphotransferase ChpT n=1 Tax=Faunimonas pinastri TaxID=1855383 RepID=A0A1H8Z9J9_9HYPH|nr:histidine phosphotransferase family protein [Faunimonas pinastri]SEP61149.1 histidine phosphotransferase ChpT [Faunimonas pinastri]
MTEYNIDPLDLAALVASRVCHDIISPVGAIVNGLEVLEEEHDESMRAFAMDLVQKSARQASAKLQFARLAFGASGGAGSEIDMVEAGRCSTAFFEREKANLDWRVPAGLLPKAQAKLLLNLLLIAMNSIARGGTIVVSAGQEGDVATLELVAEGDRARLGAGIRDVLTQGAVPSPLDAHAVQPLYAALLAQEAGMGVSVSEEENRVTLKASTRPEALAGVNDPD